MTKETLKKLYNLAEDERVKAACTLAWFRDLNMYAGGQALYRLALQCNNVEKLADLEVLQTFFTEEAVLLLKTMANEFWFWTVVREATISHVEGNEARIGVDTVKRAVLNRRRAAMFAFDLNKDITDLTREETALWVASGFIVLNGKNLVRNPIFSKPVD